MKRLTVAWNGALPEHRPGSAENGRLSPAPHLTRAEAEVGRSRARKGGWGGGEVGQGWGASKSVTGLGFRGRDCGRRGRAAGGRARIGSRRRLAARVRAGS